MANRHEPHTTTAPDAPEVTGASLRTEHIPERPGVPTDPHTPSQRFPGTRNEAPTDEARAAAHFASDAKTHKLTVHREDGFFRHVEFTGLAGLSRIALITWPYNLIVAGSHGTYHFERYGPDTEDMLNWLRVARPNPDGWASKLTNGRDSVSEYSREQLVAHVGERVQEALVDGWAPEGLAAAVAEQILGNHLLDDESTAFQLLSEFQHGMKWRVKCVCGAEAERDSYGSALMWRSVAHNKGDGHDVDIDEISGFDFDDFTEWDVRKLNYHYLWTCHAAVWAVKQYDAARQAVTA